MRIPIGTFVSWSTYYRNRRYDHNGTITKFIEGRVDLYVVEEVIGKRSIFNRVASSHLEREVAIRKVMHEARM